MTRSATKPFATRARRNRDPILMLPSAERWDGGTVHPSVGAVLADARRGERIERPRLRVKGRSGDGSVPKSLDPRQDEPTARRTIRKPEPAPRTAHRLRVTSARGRAAARSTVSHRYGRPHR